MKIINIVLSIIVVALMYFLYDTINAPIQFNKIREIRYEKISQKLEDIKKAQMAYKEARGVFADDFDKLTNFVKKDTLLVISIIGNPDDTTQVIKRDTSYESALESLFSKDYPVDELAMVPYGNGEKFNISAGEISTNNVKVKVFEVSTSNGVIFSDLEDKDFFDADARFTLGSMFEARFGIKPPLK